MRNKLVFLIILVLLVLICIVAFGWKKGSIDNSSKNAIQNTVNNDYKENIKNSIGGNEDMTDNTIRVTINDKTFTAVLEENETAKEFVGLLPCELNMSDLNGNEKFGNLDIILPTDSYNPKHIETGDVMLFGNNCLVIFYKSFDTSFSYTKIGHIENLGDLGDSDVLIRIEK